MRYQRQKECAKRPKESRGILSKVFFAHKYIDFSIDIREMRLI